MVEFTFLGAVVYLLCLVEKVDVCLHFMGLKANLKQH